MKALHINATPEDLAGNNGIGRYMFCPGSQNRAEAIAQQFEGVTVNKHPRGHDLYKGHLNHHGQKIDVASVSTGMGTASVDIIVTELFHLGAKRFLRVGTAGSMQPYVNLGDLVIALGSVRDDGTSLNYLPIEFPAVASPEFVTAAQGEVAGLNMPRHVHTGTVHCKNSFYAREFFQGPLSQQHMDYGTVLENGGTLASEMETAHFFILAAIFNQEIRKRNIDGRVLSGAILGVISDFEKQFLDDAAISDMVDDSLALGIATIKKLAVEEMNGNSI